MLGLVRFTLGSEGDAFHSYRRLASGPPVSWRASDGGPALRADAVRGRGEGGAAGRGVNLGGFVRPGGAAAGGGGAFGRGVVSSGERPEGAGGADRGEPRQRAASELRVAAVVEP